MRTPSTVLKLFWKRSCFSKVPVGLLVPKYFMDLLFDAGENDVNENLDAKIHNHVKVPIVRLLGGYAGCNLPSQELCREYSNQLDLSTIDLLLLKTLIQDYYSNNHAVLLWKHWKEIIIP